MNTLFYGVVTWENREPPSVYFGRTEDDLRYVMGLDGDAEMIPHDSRNGYTLYQPGNQIIEDYQPGKGIWRSSDF